MAAALRGSSSVSLGRAATPQGARRSDPVVSMMRSSGGGVVRSRARASLKERVGWGSEERGSLRVRARPSPLLCMRPMVATCFSARGGVGKEEVWQLGEEGEAGVRRESGWFSGEGMPPSPLSLLFPHHHHPLAPLDAILHGPRCFTRTTLLRTRGRPAAYPQQPWRRPTSTRCKRCVYCFTAAAIVVAIVVVAGRRPDTRPPSPPPPPPPHPLHRKSRPRWISYSARTSSLCSARLSSARHAAAILPLKRQQEAPTL